MSEMIERIARTLLLAHYERGRGIAPDWKSLDRFEQEKWLISARAAIAAMRGPTRTMIVAAMIQPHPSVAEAGGVIEQGQEAVKIDYQAMIDSALKED